MQEIKRRKQRCFLVVSFRTLCGKALLSKHSLLSNHLSLKARSVPDAQCTDVTKHEKQVSGNDSHTIHSEICGTNTRTSSGRGNKHCRNNDNGNRDLLQGEVSHFVCWTCSHRLGNFNEVICYRCGRMMLDVQASGSSITEQYCSPWH